jgi:hypothetical protein
MRQGQGCLCPSCCNDVIQASVKLVTRPPRLRLKPGTLKQKTSAVTSAVGSQTRCVRAAKQAHSSRAARARLRSTHYKQA